MISLWIMALSGDGRRLVTFGNNGRNEVWDLAKTDIKPIVLPGERFGASQAVALSADGRRLVSCAAGGCNCGVTCRI